MTGGLGGVERGRRRPVRAQLPGQRRAGPAVPAGRPAVRRCPARCGWWCRRTRSSAGRCRSPGWPRRSRWTRPSRRRWPRSPAGDASPRGTGAAGRAGRRGAGASGGALGLPGLVDVHVHFLPPRLLAAVWAYFDARRASTTAGPGRSATGHQRRRAGRRCCAASACGRSPRWRTRTSPGMAASSTTGPCDLAARTPDCVPVGDVLPRAGRRRVRPGGARPRRPGRSRRTCRSAATTRPTRCSTRSGGAGRGRARRWSCTAAPARCRGAHTGAGADRRRCCARHPAADAGRRARRAAGLPRSSSRWPTGTRGCTWTPRWSAPPFTEQMAPLPAELPVPAGRPGRPGGARHRLPEHPVPVRRPAGGAGRGWTSATTGCAPCAGRQRGPAARPGSRRNRRRRWLVCLTCALCPHLWLGLAPQLASAFLATGVVAGGYAADPMWWSTSAGDATRATAPSSSSAGGSGFSGGSAGGGGGGGGGGAPGRPGRGRTAPGVTHAA